MKFEEALKAMREGKRVKRPIQSVPKSMIGGKIFEVYKDGKQNVIYSKLDSMNCVNIEADDWELYKDPELDWDYIIKNKCLCWLWDDNYNWAICGTLGKIEKGDEYKFVMFDDEGNRSPYKNCRPVSRDEVTFYEERKDE